MTEAESPRLATPTIDLARQRPPWLTIRVGAEGATTEVRQLLGDLGLHTVCEEARCPNQRECWDSRTATFLILGDRCTRRCSYCAIETGQPSGAVDWAEPGRIARAVSRLGLRHVVVTSVTRDDLEDGGAGVFAATVRRIRTQDSACSIEVLIPDMGARRSSIEMIVGAGPDVVNHNIETVRRLHDQVRPRCGYDNSLQVLAMARELGARCTKSGLMVGLGETHAEIEQTLADLRSARVDIVTIGQYLRPTGQSRHVPVSRYYTPAEFEALRTRALGLGFAHVEAGPLVRSSYHAREQLEGHRLIDSVRR